ncbi:MAG: NADH-quinone oxidoreductase subunit C [Candidatus Coatesbacteria bacterium]|nr:NADH-quinone oxidoreductase subunit C [Candidatus Coatesbacteria bacterium]
MQEAVLNKLTEDLGPKLKKVFRKSKRRVYIDVEPENLLEVAKYVLGIDGVRYAIATGIDTPVGFEVLHHFDFDKNDMVVSVRALADRENPRLPSVATITKAAEWIEREMHDLLGIEFEDHPDMRRLLLPEDWPDDVFPLRRGKPWEGKVPKKI